MRLIGASDRKSRARGRPPALTDCRQSHKRTAQVARLSRTTPHHTSLRIYFLHHTSSEPHELNEDHEDLSVQNDRVVVDFFLVWKLDFPFAFWEKCFSCLCGRGGGGLAAGRWMVRRGRAPGCGRRRR